MGWSGPGQPFFAARDKPCSHDRPNPEDHRLPGAPTTRSIRTSPSSTTAVFGAVPIPVQEDFQNWHRTNRIQPGGFFMVTVVPEGTETGARRAGGVRRRSDQAARIRHQRHDGHQHLCACPANCRQETRCWPPARSTARPRKAMQYWARQAGAGYRIQEVPFSGQGQGGMARHLLEGRDSRHEGTVLQPHHRPHRVHAAHGGTMCQSPRGRYRDGGGRRPTPPATLTCRWNRPAWTSTPATATSGCPVPGARASFMSMNASTSSWKPLVVSHGWDPDVRSDDPVQEYVNYQGTIDPCARLSVAGGHSVSEGTPHAGSAHTQSRPWPKSTRQAIADLFGMPMTCADDQGWFSQMVTAWLPPGSAEKIGDGFVDQVPDHHSLGQCQGR